MKHRKLIRPLKDILPPCIIIDNAILRIYKMSYQLNRIIEIRAFRIAFFPDLKNSLESSGKISANLTLAIILYWRRLFVMNDAGVIQSLPFITQKEPFFLNLTLSNEK